MKYKISDKSRKDLPKIVGHVIRKLRDQKGLTQAQLAFDLEVEPETISRLETGNISATLDRLLQLSAYFGCSIETFFKDDEEDLTMIIDDITACLDPLSPEDKKKVAAYMVKISKLYIKELQSSVPKSQPALPLDAEDGVGLKTAK